MGLQRELAATASAKLSLGLAAESWPMEDPTPPGRVVWVPRDNRGSLGPCRNWVLGWSVPGSRG